MYSENRWVIIKNSSQKGKVIETTELWGSTILTVWVPVSDAIVRLSPEEVEPASQSRFYGDESMLRYIAAATRVRDTLSSSTLISPLNSSVIPLPHQLEVLQRAMQKESLRLLLADEVGLGKTIEAGLIFKELKLRNLVKRVLVVVPKSLTTQWQEEMKLHFNEEFHLLIPQTFQTYRSAFRTENVWKIYEQVVCPLDSIKPVESRSGWNKKEVEGYNRERTEDILDAGWDLIIVDEAHRLGGSTARVARHKLGKTLSQATDRILFLSATPHQGKSESFFRIMSLLDDKAFGNAEQLNKENVSRYVIRTQKRNAIDSSGNTLFTKRTTQLVPVAWGENTTKQKSLYEAVTDYVRRGYNRAEKERKNYIGFLMILMQRMVSSSTRAIRSALERRSTVLGEPEEQLSLFPAITGEEWYDLDGDEQAETLLASRLEAVQTEREEVQLLLDTARIVEERSVDAKTELLHDIIYRQQKEESDPFVKILVFTEFIHTQEMLADYLTERGFSVVCLNGQMSIQDRIRVQERFADDARIMISTDAGGEGLNLQFCHIVVNYDMPWNPMKLEQRIGRADRIGQKRAVKAVNLMLEDTVEFRIREVLEEKLSVIYREFGIDKTEDVLDSEQAGSIFESMFIESIADPDAIEEKVNQTTETIKKHLKEVQEQDTLLSPLEKITPQTAQDILSHPFPSWVETMTTSYISSSGGSVKKDVSGLDLSWPDGESMKNVLFSVPDDGTGACTHLTVDHRKIWPLVENIPLMIEGEPIPVIHIDELPDSVRGVWSIHCITVTIDEKREESLFPLFVHKDERILHPTAGTIWDAVLFGRCKILSIMQGKEAKHLYIYSKRKAIDASGETYRHMVERYQKQRAIFPELKTHLIAVIE
jgi:ERCC4-related helicase